MSLLKKLAGETAIYGVSSILSRILNYIVMTPYLTKFFPRADYAVVSEMYAYVALLMVFFTYRMETAFFRFATKKEGQMETVFSTASISLFFTTLIFTFLLIQVSPILGQVLENDSYQNYLVWFAFILAFDTLSAIPFARLRLQNRPIKFAILKTFSIIINILSILVLINGVPYLIEHGWDGLAQYYDFSDQVKYVFIANFLGSLFVFLALLPDYRNINLRFDKALYKEMLIYAAPLIVVGLAATINQLVSIPLMIELLPGASREINKIAAGEYAACFKIGIMMSLGIQAFNYAAEPFFFRNVNRNDAKEVYAQVGQAFALAGSFIFLGITFYIDIFKQLIRNPDYWIALGIVPYVLLAFLFQGLYYNFSIWYKLNDRTILGAYISVGGAIITLVINVLFLPIEGYYAAAYAILACYFFMAMASYLTGQKYYPIPYPMKKIMLYIGLAVGIYFIGYWLDQQLAFTLVIRLLVNTFLLLVYSALIIKIEEKAVRTFLKNRKK